MLLRSHVEKYDAAIFDVAVVRARGHLGADRTSCRRRSTRTARATCRCRTTSSAPCSSSTASTRTRPHGLPDVAVRRRRATSTGVVDAWQLVREAHPDLQLVIVLTTEPHDPPGRACYDELARRCARRARRCSCSAWATSSGTSRSTSSSGRPRSSCRRACARASGCGSRTRSGRSARASWRRSAGCTEQVIDGETGLVAAHDGGVRGGDRAAARRPGARRRS